MAVTRKDLKRGIAWSPNRGRYRVLPTKTQSKSALRNRINHRWAITVFQLEFETMKKDNPHGKISLDECKRALLNKHETPSEFLSNLLRTKDEDNIDWYYLLRGTNSCEVRRLLDGLKQKFPYLDYDLGDINDKPDDELDDIVPQDKEAIQRKNRAKMDLTELEAFLRAFVVTWDEAMQDLQG